MPLEVVKRICIIICLFKILSSQFAGEYPDGCDTSAATQCEKDFYYCRLYTGPADDAPTMCRCGKDFYGACLRKAGCMLHLETVSQPYILYLRQCVNFIMKYDCPDTLVCSINCASETNIDRTISKIVPFNNYGPYYLRLRLCNHTVHPEKLKRYGIVYPATCSTMDEFQICSRWIPPNTFTPVALPINTTYMLVDYCEVRKDGTQFCHITEPSPTRLYGNKISFPSTFDVPKSAFSICKSDDDCLGSFCDKSARPHTCSPKSLFHVTQSGLHYFDEPFG
eukprot:gene8289-17050_t